MSEGNAQRLQEFVAQWNAGAVDPGLELLAEDVEIHTPFSSIAGEPYRGHDGYRRWRSDITEQFELFQLHVDEIRELSDQRLLVVGAARVRGRGSGVTLDQPATTLFEMRAGQVLRLQVFLSEDEALRAAAARD